MYRQASDSGASRRMSHNSRLMRNIMDRLRDYTLDEVRLICDKFRRRHGRPATVSGRWQTLPPDGEAPRSEDAPGDEQAGGA